MTGPQYRFTLIGETVLRYEWSSDGVFEDRASTFALNRSSPRRASPVKETEEELEIVAPTLTSSTTRTDSARTGCTSASAPR